MKCYQSIAKVFSFLGVVLICINLTAAQTGAPAKPFEGLIQLQVQDWQSVEMVNYYIKGDRARMESSPNTSAEPYYILDYLSKKMFVVMTNKDSYLELSMEKPPEPQASADSKPESMIKTDETETVLGFPCEQWILKENDVTTTMWATKAFNANVTLLGLQKQDTPVSFRWDEELKSRGLFPLKLAQQDINGTDMYKFEVLKIQRKTVNELLFRIPEGYEKIDKPIITKPIKSKK